MIIEVNAENLAHLLARKKVEKKYESLGFSPYKENYEEYVGLLFTEDAQKDFEIHYNNFYNTIMSRKRKAIK